MSRLAGLLAVLLLTPNVGSTAPAEQSVLAGACYGCHSETQRTDPGQLPTLAGQSSAAIERALLEYRSDRRTGTLMNRIAKGYSEAQLKVLAQHFGKRATD